jgi:catechol 2,3-dioxygenase-like lactoylglutathione lyase family enzyme
MSRLFSAAGANYVGVRDLAAAASWYKERLALREVNVEMDDGEGCIALGFSNEEYIIALGPTGRPTDELRPLLYTSNIKKAREFLKSRGAGPSEIEKDAQGTAYFEIHDPEGNVIEICEEP